VLLHEWIRARDMDEKSAMDLLQDLCVVSDNCVTAKDVALENQAEAKAKLLSHRHLVRRRN